MKLANLLLWLKSPSKNIPSAPTPVDGGGGVTAAAGAAVAFSASAWCTFICICIINNSGRQSSPVD